MCWENGLKSQPVIPLSKIMQMQILKSQINLEGK